MAEWNANTPVAMLAQYAANLRRLRSLALDIGLQDRVFPIAGNQPFDRLLTDLSISHSFEIYEGTHTSRIAERLDRCCRISRGLCHSSGRGAADEESVSDVRKRNPSSEQMLFQVSAFSAREAAA